MITNITLVVVSFVLAGVFFWPRLMRARLWRATVTPLASIIGSGFLVAGPILANAAGRQAWIAMAGLCTLAYLFGAAIRHNIQHVEPRLTDDPPKAVQALEWASKISLALAYFVSVAYYLNLFSAFALRLGDIQDPFWIRVVATVLISTVGAVGVLGGLKELERLEVDAVSLKLAVIGGLFAALIVGSAIALSDGTFSWPTLEHERGLQEAQVLLGLVILVQGFETSRYLGREYNAAERIRTMRWAQWIASGIYVVFILLITRYFRDELPPEGGETAIIDILAPLGPAVGPVLIVAALASQSSAAIADMNGAGGLLAEAGGKQVNVKLGNLLTAAAALAVTWLGDIYEIITFASKAFVVYYALECTQAAVSALGSGKRLRAGLFVLGGLAAIAVVLFAQPAKA